MASSHMVLGLTALVFCTWAVSLAGIASVQDKCEPTWALGNGLSCMKQFRYEWFIVSLEFVLICGLGIAVAAGAYARTRLSWVGLFAVATLLYIQMTNEFLNYHDAVDQSNAASSVKSRINTMLAGCIMTATVNCFLLIVFGINDEEAPKAMVSEKTAAV